MSIEQVAEFWQEIGEDEGLRQKLAAVNATDADGLVRAVATVAGEHGYDVTESDLLQLMEAGQENAPGELEDSQLDAVVGGSLNFSHSTFNSIESGLYSMKLMDTSNTFIKIDG